MTFRSVLYNELVFVKRNSTQQQNLLWNLKFCLHKAVNRTWQSIFLHLYYWKKTWFWALQIRYSLFINNCFWVNSSTLNRVSTVAFTVSVLWRDFCEIISKKYHKSLPKCLPSRWIPCNDQWMLTSLPEEYSASVSSYSL